MIITEHVTRIPMVNKPSGFRLAALQKPMVVPVGRITPMESKGHANGGAL